MSNNLWMSNSPYKTSLIKDKTTLFFRKASALFLKNNVVLSLIK